MFLVKIRVVRHQLAAFMFLHFLLFQVCKFPTKQRVHNEVISEVHEEKVIVIVFYKWLFKESDPPSMHCTLTQSIHHYWGTRKKAELPSENFHPFALSVFCFKQVTSLHKYSLHLLYLFLADWAKGGPWCSRNYQ